MEQYRNLLIKLLKNGKIVTVRGLNTLEIINYRIDINNGNLYSVPNIRDFSKIKKYLFGELSWYFSGSTDVDGILKYSKFWNKIKNEDNTVNSNYGYLVFYKKNLENFTQYEWAKNSLMNDVNSRKSVILYNDKDYCYVNNLDFPCTQLQQFFIRNNELLSIVYIRSSDVIRGLTYDIPWWSLVQQYMYLELLNKYKKLKIGKLTINFGSVHIYEDDIKLVNDMLNKKMLFYNLKLNKIIPINHNQKWYEKNLKKYISIYEI